MIAHNEVKMHGELANKTDNRTVSYKLYWEDFSTH